MTARLRRIRSHKLAAVALPQAPATSPILIIASIR